MPAAAPLRPQQAPLTGIALRSAAVASLAVLAVSIKLAAARGVGLVEIMFWRNAFSAPVIVGWVLLGPGLGSLRTPRIGAHATRSALGLGVMALNFLAITLLPLAEAAAIGFSTPLFATALAPLLLHERVGAYRWGAVALGFAGVLIMVRPGGAAIPALPLAAGLIAAAGSACVQITLRQIGATERATTTVFWFNAASLAATALLLPFVWHPHPAAAWPWLALIGIAGGCAQIMMTASLRYASVPTLAPFDYAQLVWAALLGWLAFATLPAPATIVGGAIIAASGVVIALRERSLRAPPVTTAAAADL